MGDLAKAAQGHTRLGEFMRSYLETESPRMGSNLALLRDLLPGVDRFLDVGSFGVEAVLLQQEFPECEIEAIAYEGNRLCIRDGAVVEASEADADSLQVREVDVERERFPFPDDHFDLVTSFEALEHLKFTPVPMLQEIKRVLAPGGRLVLTTPNLGGTTSILKLLSGLPPQEVPGYHRDPAYGVIHPKEYTITEIEGLFVAIGFGDLHITSRYFRRPMLAERLLTLMLCALRPFTRWKTKRRIPVLPGDNFVLNASKGGPQIEEWPRAIFRDPD